MLLRNPFFEVLRLLAQLGAAGLPPPMPAEQLKLGAAVVPDEGKGEGAPAKGKAKSKAAVGKSKVAAKRKAAAKRKLRAKHKVAAKSEAAVGKSKADTRREAAGISSGEDADAGDQDAGSVSGNQASEKCLR